VRSMYVGKGEMAHMIATFESSSAEVEKLMRAKASIEADALQWIEDTLDRAVDLVHLFTQANLLAAGFHTHHRQWRRKRKCQ